MSHFSLNVQASAAAARLDLIAAASGEGTLAAISAAVVVRRNEASGLAKSSLKALAEALADASQGRAKAKTFQNYLSVAAQAASHDSLKALCVEGTAADIASAFKAALNEGKYGYGMNEAAAFLNGEASPIAAKAEAAKAAKAAKAAAAKAEAEAAAADPIGHAEALAAAAMLPLAKALLGLLTSGQAASPHLYDLTKAAASATLGKAADGSTKAAKAAAAALREIASGLSSAAYNATAEAEAAEAEAADEAATAAKAAKAAAIAKAIDAKAEAEAEAAEAAAKAAAAIGKADEAAEVAQGAAEAAKAAKGKNASAMQTAAGYLRRLAEAAAAEVLAAKAAATAKAAYAEAAAKAAEAAAA